MNPVRFRADPARVRVAVLRSFNYQWLAKVTPKGKPAPLYWASSNNPEVAVLNALVRAAEDELPGVDLDLQRAFDHPQHNDQETAPSSACDRLLKIVANMPTGFYVQIGPEADDEGARFLAATAWTGQEEDKYEGLLFGVSAEDGDCEKLARLLADAIEKT